MQDHPSRPQTPQGRLDCAHVRRATLLLRQGPNRQSGEEAPDAPQGNPSTLGWGLVLYWEYILPAEDNPGGGFGADQGRGGCYYLSS